MKKIYFAALVFLTGEVIGQIPVKPIMCGNELFTDIVQRHYPALQDAFLQTFEDAAHATPARGFEPLTIQVVVHVVWKEEAENLHDSIILDQIRVLNEDFNRRNADTANLRSRFVSEAGSADIHFELAEIIRVHTQVNFEIGLLSTNLLTEVKTSAEGGSGAIDPDHYLNIWVCKIQPITIFGIELGQILGFAFPPNNLPHWPENVGAPSPEQDGVVIDYRVFGSNNPNAIQIPGGGGPLRVKGRTPVHEVGHYLGLRHIWGDGGILGPNDCAQSDGIDDTPFASSQSSFDCDTTRNTCSQIELHYQEDVPDLIENYMDYASEDCMNMFTRGQVQLMRNILLGPRSGLISPFTAVKNPVSLLDFNLLPNPTNGPFSVQFETSEPFDASIRILNINGQVLMERPNQSYTTGPHHIPFDGFNPSAGMYFVEIRNHHSIANKKLIVY